MGEISNCDNACSFALSGQLLEIVFQKNAHMAPSVRVPENSARSVPLLKLLNVGKLGEYLVNSWRSFGNEAETFANMKGAVAVRDRFLKAGVDALHTGQSG